MRIMTRWQADRGQRERLASAGPSGLTWADSPKATVRQAAARGRIGCVEIGANDAAGFGSCCRAMAAGDPAAIVAHPCRAFDAGLRRRPLEARPEPATRPPHWQLPRTELPPAGDDELTNTKKHRGTTSRCHLPLCWAHESSRLGQIPARSPALVTSPRINGTCSVLM